MSDTPKPRLLVCAAMRMQDGLIVTGVRHYSPDMRAVLKRLYGDGYHLKVEEQGFIDNRYEFVTRADALALALANGQRRFRCGGDEIALYSEGLY